MGRVTWILVVLLGWGMTSCNFRREKFSLDGIATEAIDFTVIKNYVLEPNKCLTCHSVDGKAGGAQLDSYAALINTKLKMPLVTPGRPSESQLLESVAEKRMPSGGPFLSAAELRLLSRWIEAGAREGVSTEPKSKPTDPRPSYAWLKQNIFKARCDGCHNAKKKKGDVDLSTYDSLLNASPGESFKAVEVGKPEESSLYLSVKSGDMPQGENSRKLDEREVEAVRLWIANGAANN